ncbi:unnamed protein product [Vitrella brassicaformis CCMP3155]|uniref:N-acylglucosamine 2-epimerase n=1 Tax=Vitrella brassicaformis (strain CCMP3155) TaxID=1169540 RepID=A0A0G4EWZ5_VITBC|nr:unnamed protein product [Vitrella brassicaformis CCMP3155]|eukprot:CEM03176.1 unnamed protein product [Vitrella brassicaformis CCMP3155]
MTLSAAAVVLLVSSARAAAQPSPSSTDASLELDCDEQADVCDLIRQIYDKTVVLENELLDFWLRYGPDEEKGGFYGEIDENGVGNEESPKFLQQQTRHLWSLSATYTMRAERREEVANVTLQLMQFIYDSFWDDDANFFSYKVSADGERVLDASEKVYSNAFAIYGFSAFAMAFANRFPDHAKDARKRSMQVYRTLRSRFVDEANGGYIDTLSPGYKGHNTLLHLLEAFTSLYLLTGDEDVLDSLDELFAIHLDHVIVGDYCLDLMNMDWTPADNRDASYGHGIETVWLLLDSARAVNRTYSGLVEALTQVGEHHSREGYDAERGGFYTSFQIASPTQKDTSKVWWVQAEALLGIWAMYEETGDIEYLRRLLGMVEWIETYQRVDKPGLHEWWVATGETGSPPGFKTLSFEWKSSYHTVRALLFLNAWISKSGVVGPTTT